MKEIQITLVSVVAIFAFITFSCAQTGYQRYNTQGGALVGSALGALAGQAIGHNTASTLIGAGGGALAGALVGNVMDQDQAYRGQHYRDDYASQYPSFHDYTRHGNTYESPPGQWVQVPGRWVNGQWVPSHQVWVPVNP